MSNLSRLSRRASKNRSQAAHTRRRSFFETLEDRSLMATLTWDGGGAADNFNDPLNWDNAGANQLPVSNDTLVFSGIAPATITNDIAAGTTFALQFTAGGYTITGNSINLNQTATGTAFGIQNTTGTNAVNTPLTLGNAGGNTVDVGAGTLTLGNAVANGAGNALTKIGGGSLVHTGTNTYTGTTTITAGTLVATTAASLGAAAAQLNLNGGNLTIRSDAAINFGAKPVLVTASSSVTQQRPTAGAGLSHAFGTLSIGSFVLTAATDASVTSGAATLDFAGLASVTGNATFSMLRGHASSNQQVRFNGGITDGGVARTVTFDNTNTITGETIAVFTAARTWTAGTQIDITGTQLVRLIVQSPSLTDNATYRFNNTVTGAGSVLDLRNNADAVFTNNIILDSNAELRHSRVAAGPGNDYTIGSITINGTRTFTINPAGNQVTTNTPYSITTSGILLNGNGTFNVPNLGTGVGQFIVTGAVTQMGGARTFTKTGSGTLELRGNDSYTGGTTLQGGTTILVGPKSTTGNTTINAGTNTTLRLTDVNSLGTAASQLLVSTGATTPTIQLFIDGAGSNSTITLPQSFGGNSGITTTFNVNNNGGGNTNNVIHFAGTTASWGNATMNVTGGNGYGLSFARIANSGGSAGTATFNPTTAPLSIGTLTSASNFAKTFVLGGTNANNRVTGVISNGGGAAGIASITKSNTSIWTLTGANTYTGTTTISGGVLQIGDGGASGTFGTAGVVNDASLVFNRNNSYTVPNLISGTGNVTQAGSGTTTLTGANTYLGTTTVAGGRLTLNNVGANAIDDAAGLVTVQAGAQLELLTNETLSAYLGEDNLANEADGELILNGNTLTTVGAATIANVTTAAGGGIIAGSSITDNDADNNITGANVYLQAATGIGTAANAIETAVGSIQLNNTASGDISILNSNAGALLTVADLRTLGFGSDNAGNATTIVNGSPLTIAANVSSAGPVVHTGMDSAGVGDNFTINGGVLVESTGSSVTLNVGDIGTITGDVTSATTTTINVDAIGGGVADAGTGGSLTITGVITTPTVGLGGGTFINGFTDNDTFTFNPQTTTEFRLFGDLPTGSNTGDTLFMDVSGTTDPVLTVPGTIAPYNGLGSGAWDFASAHRDVLFGSIEVSTITGDHHVIYDNSIAPVANIVLMRDSALPTANVQLRDGSTIGNIIYQGTMDQILSLRVLGSAGNETLTVDDINTLPDFGGTVPGVTDNLNLAGTAELLFDGLGGTDSLVYNINGTTASQSYAIGDGTGAAGLAGEVQSIAAGITLDAYFQNVELGQRTGVGASPQGLTIIGDASGNAFSTAANGAFTRTTITGYTPFEFSGNNYNAVTINALAGTDVIDLVNLGTGQTNNPGIFLNGGTENDTIRVQSTSLNTGLVSLNGGLGNDLFQLFDGGNTVDNIAGPVDVDGADGSVGGNTDTLLIVDSGDLSGDNNVVIAAVDAGLSQDYYVDGINTVVSSDVVLRNIDTLDYTSTSGDDTIDGRFVNTAPAHDLTAVVLSGWLGADLFRLLTSDQIGGTGPNNTPTGVASGVATINLYGDAPTNPNAGDGNDTFGDSPPAPFTGTGATNVGLAVSSDTRMIRPSVSTAITIDGGTPTGLATPLGDATGDVLNVNISDLPNTTPVVVSTFGPGTVAVLGGVPVISPLVWSEIEDINLVDQNKLTNVQMGDLFARTTPNPDFIQITRDPTPLNPNRVRLRTTASIGNYSASNKTIIYAGGMNDTITQANLTIPAEFYGEDGDDYLSGAMNNDWLVGGLGSDRINGSGGDNVIWGDNSPTNPGDLTPQDGPDGGNDQLSALGGNDVFYGGAGNDTVSGGAGNDYAYGGQGNDTLDGNDGDDRLYGGTGNDIISGHAGNDLLSGSDNDDKLYGSSGNDVIFGGNGIDLIDGGSGNDLLVTGSVANENSSWTSAANTTTFSPATYTLGSDNDAALLTFLNQWAATSPPALGDTLAITHDGLNDDVWGSTEDDDFCWEAADVLDNFPGTTPPDFNAVGMGTDARFGPT